MTNETPQPQHEPTGVLAGVSKILLALEPLAALAPLLTFAVGMLRRLLAAPRNLESYETLALAYRLHIQDRNGRGAWLERDQRIRFRAGEAGVVRDLVWGEGEPLASYQAGAAEPVRLRREGSKQVVWLALPNRPAPGETATVRSRRRVVDALTNDEEYLEVEVERPTRRIALSVTFPRSRPPMTAYVLASPGVIPKRQLIVRWDLGPRPQLEWLCLKPVPFTRYRLCRTW